MFKPLNYPAVLSASELNTQGFEGASISLNNPKQGFGQTKKVPAKRFIIYIDRPGATSDRELHTFYQTKCLAAVVSVKADG